MARCPPQFLQNKAQLPKRRSLIPLVLIGSGLILLGVMAALLLLRPSQKAPGAGETSSEPSAIPLHTASPAPALELNDLQGQPVSLLDYRGGWLLVNNWATWCPPCKAEMPTLQAFYEEHRQQNFELVAIEAGGAVEDVARFVDQYQLRFTVWPDPDEKVYQAFRNVSLPTSWLIDPIGQIRLTWTGAISREMLEKFVTPLLKE
jgi:peroxiredoxin